MDASLAKVVEALLAPWSGPLGGLPPFDVATPEAIGEAYATAVERKRAEARAIAGEAAAPTFANTIEALEDCGRELRRMECLYRVFSSTMGSEAMREVDRRLAPLLPALEDELAHDDALFARVDSVYRNRSALTAPQQRLTAFVRDRMVRRGAGLGPAAKQRLAELNGRIAALFAQFSQNLVIEQDAQAVFLEHETDLEGLPPDVRRAAASAAEEKGRAGVWAIANARPAVWPFLTLSPRRDLREKVWRMWSARGANEGPQDNRPVIRELVRLRGEKARLLGYPTFAHFTTADRMARTPETALALMQRVWDRILPATVAQIADLQALADAEGAGFELAPWDRLFHAEKLRQARYGLDAEAVKPYLELESVLNAMFWEAGRLHGLTFERLAGAPVCHPDVRVYAVRRGDEPVGALWIDVLYRPGKMRGSWQQEYRCSESFRGRVLPLASINSNLAQPAPGEPVLLPWEYANVFFHEFGHALHMLCSEAPYPSLGSVNVAWDFVELPSMLNERWLLERELLGRFARHCRTGEPIPPELVDSIEKAAQFDRITTLTIDYLGSAIADMRLYLLADGRDVDPVALEAEVLGELGMPAAGDLILRMPHAYHTFSDMYAAGLYVYLWADVMAADAAEAFAESAGGLYDGETAERYRRTILSAGNTVPPEDAFRAFRGRDPDPKALLRKYGLL